MESAAKLLTVLVVTVPGLTAAAQRAEFEVCMANCKFSNISWVFAQA